MVMNLLLTLGMMVVGIGLVKYVGSVRLVSALDPMQSNVEEGKLSL